MIKLAMLGSGIITECHYFGLTDADAQIVAIASTDKEQATEACTKYGARYYSDYHELLQAEKGQVDAIIVALPNFMHYEACIAAINMGYKNILCEKPMCTREEDADKLAALVKQEGVFFQTGYMKRFNPGFQRVKSALENIGTPSFATFSIYFSSPEPDPNPQKGEPGSWYGVVEKTGGAALTHNGSHHIDLMRYMFGDVTAVTAKMRYDVHSGGEYYISAKLEMTDGVEVDMRIGRVDVPNMGPDFSVFRDGWNETVEVIGSRGYIKCENPTWQGYESLQVKEWRQHAPGPETIYLECNEQWKKELHAFVESVKTGKYDPAASTVIDGYRTDAIIAAMHRSAKQGGQRTMLDYKH
ncbi:Gfo/Idh/MocA family protein [Paenibacillus sp. NPDC058174]|uniref:Gfo/Idh/MocA family protein n=1 Tax=Paenibacillus sp. NPDC058174 TaxID=3346366 RepID=UPI0036D8B2E4